MTSLVWRIFLAFWAVLIVALLCTVAYNALVARDTAAARAELLAASTETLAAQAQSAFDAGGPARLRDWLEQQQRLLDTPLWIVAADGRDLLDRPLPPLVRALVMRSGARTGLRPPGLPPARRGEPVAGRPRMPRPGVIEGDGMRYLLFVANRERDPRGARLLSPEARRVFPLLLIVLSGAACLWLARYLTWPIAQFRNAGQAIAGGNLAARVGPAVAARGDEFGALAKDFDQMAERVEQLLDSRQRLLRDVSHELRSPLARLQTAVGLLRQRAGQPAATEVDYLERIEREADRLNAMIGDILAYARLDTATDIERCYADLREILDDVIDNAAFEAQPTGKTVELSAPESLSVQLDGELIRSALDNVVRNAVQHAASTVSVRCASDSVAAVITVRDDGPGAQDADLDKLFDAFFTHAPSNSAGGHGAGIGLAIARRAVELHGGTISAANAAPGSGLEVTLRLPLV